MNPTLPNARLHRGSITVPPPLREVPVALRRALARDACVPIFVALSVIAIAVAMPHAMPWWMCATIASFVAVFAYGACRSSARWKRTTSILRHGLVTGGKEIARTVLIRGDGETSELFMVTFEYTAADDIARTHLVATKCDASAIGGDVQMLYHPADPTHALVLAELPGAPRIVGGAIETALRYSARYLVLPAACVALVIAAIIFSVLS